MATEKPFERIVTEHGAVVLRVCRAVLGPGPDADEAWSETFLAALRAWPGLAEGTNVQAWLVTIAHRKAIDVTRARARRAVPMAEPPERATADPPADTELWDRVAALPDKQRLALAYHYFGGLPYPRVAELIGGSADAARRAGADGIRALRLTLRNL
ncbi:RNA polymerase subunit sigma-24 [Prauserella marina]|uniref:RNA polymerase sigma factor, sigma-70 family n=1 Tax=Prauserella marina TaxID=530584 RepID=A0A222VLA0_9PSEU|nr:sigma-70 family RNA polymerase sigma factor [Prauserella marina]ASR34533.1 RNA polymerase subunit sigma-24 [Prauserella marina]PWV85859.1 RNA polymerase sigma factor (sigma-70 family) [Prauserella marina]SDC43741.1 RNA polymerase sigma factor, sigma-70 family [Prauserella marina]